MEYLIIFLKVIVGLSILNVWLVNRNKASQWRGGQADSMKAEFKNYGLSENMMIVTGVVKCLLAVALLISIFYFPLGLYAALGIAFMMAVAIAMHLKISDPIKKSLPAFAFLVLSLIIAFV